MGDSTKKVTIILEEGERDDSISFDTNETAEDTFAILVLGVFAMLDIPEDKVKDVCDYLVSQSGKRSQGGEPKYVH